MQARLVHALQRRRPEIRLSWETLLRIEPVTSPLANPDTLVHLINHSFDQVMAAVPGPAAPVAENGPFRCPCGRNPMIAYFAAGRQALHEAVILIQAESGALGAGEREAGLKAVDEAIQRVANQEIEAFCGVCQFREGVPG